MKNIRIAFQALLPLVLVFSLILAPWVTQTSLAAEDSSGDSVTESHSSNNTEQDDLPATCFADSESPAPVPPDDDGNLEPSTAYDYDSSMYGGVNGSTVDPLQFLIGNPGSTSAIDLSLVSLHTQRFPFIYLTVRASKGGQPVTNLTKANFSVTEDGRLQTDMFDVVPPEEGGGLRMADIIFLIDNSGSMGDEIAAVKNNCEAFADALAASDIDYRLGLVQFGQYANGGHPRLIGSGLTGNVSEFKSWVATMVAYGSYEPGFAAIRLAIQSYSFRPVAQKVFILITDEDSDDRDKQTTIDLILANDVTVHVAADCSFGTSQADYCGPGSVRDVSGGLLFSVMGDYRSILDTIGQVVASTYIVRYRTDNPVLDGVERTVVCTVQDGAATDFVQCTYIPGGAPRIQRTKETLALHERALVASSSPTISVEVTDAAAPFVQGVFLYVRTSGSATGYVKINMLPQGNDIYAAAVPGGHVKAPALDYYVRATDGQVTSSAPTTDPDKNPYQIAVLPNEAPVIEHTPPTSWQTGNDVSLWIVASDSTHGIVSLNVYFRKQGDLLWQSVLHDQNPPDTMIGRTAVLPVARWATQAIEYYIKVTDDLGVSRCWPEGGADTPFVLTSQAPRGILLISSEEDSWPIWGWSNDMSHILALNVTRAIDERNGFDQRIADITSQGGLAIVAHPAAPRRPRFWETIAMNENVTAVEIWNHGTEEDSKTWKGGFGTLFSGEYLVEWDEITNYRVSRNEKPVWGIAVDDAHRLDQIDKAWVMVRAPELKEDSVLEALRNGSFYAVLGPWPVPQVIDNISVSPDNTTISVTMNDAVVNASKAKVVRGKDFIVPLPERQKTYTYKVNQTDIWVRIEINLIQYPATYPIPTVWTQPFVCRDGKVVTNPYQTTGSWYKAQLHCHTTRSDGHLTPEQVVQEYSKRGYQILAITDHNRITTPSSDRTMYVAQVFLRYTGVTLQANVVIWGNDRADSSYRDYYVSDALVTGYWEDLGGKEYKWTDSIRYREGGIAVFERVVRPRKSFTFVVDSVTKNGWTWYPDDPNNVPLRKTIGWREIGRVVDSTAKPG